MSGHRIGQDFSAAFSGQVLHISDPGTGNTIDIPYSHCVCGITTTGGSETRKLPDPTGYPVGTEITVYNTVDGGDFNLTVDSSGTIGTDAGAPQINVADNTTAAFNNDGDFGKFLLIKREDTKVWHLIASGGLSLS